MSRSTCHGNIRFSSCSYDGKHWETPKIRKDMASWIGKRSTLKTTLPGAQTSFLWFLWFPPRSVLLVSCQFPPFKQFVVMREILGCPIWLSVAIIFSQLHGCPENWRFAMPQMFGSFPGFEIAFVVQFAFVHRFGGWRWGYYEGSHQIPPHRPPCPGHLVSPTL